MPLVSEIKDIQAAHLELLEALGISETGQLAEQAPERLAAEIKAANRALAITKRCPSKSTISKWIAAAAEFSESDEEAEVSDSSMPSLPVLPAVNYEAAADVIPMLANAPFAIPMPSKIMMENQIRVGDIPAGLLLNRYSGDLDVRLWEAGDSSVSRGDTKPNSSQDLIVDMPSKADAVPIKAQPAVPMEPRTKIPKSKPEVDRVSLIRAPLESTNRGKNPNSRRYVRGVLHTQPWGLRIGAFSSLILFVILPIAIVSALLLLLSSEIPEKFGWVPQWIILFPLSLPLVGILYLIWGLNGKCRICNQKLFVHRAALKHLKAHHIPGFGYIVPLCLHLLLFSWFRCSSCGTPVRLKK